MVDNDNEIQQSNATLAISYLYSSVYGYVSDVCFNS
jgi:hypothetical protein